MIWIQLAHAPHKSLRAIQLDLLIITTQRVTMAICMWKILTCDQCHQQRQESLEFFSVRVMDDTKCSARMRRRKSSIMHVLNFILCVS